MKVADLMVLDRTTPMAYTTAVNWKDGSSYPSMAFVLEAGNWEASAAWQTMSVGTYSRGKKDSLIITERWMGPGGKSASPDEAQAYPLETARKYMEIRRANAYKRGEEVDHSFDPPTGWVVKVVRARDLVATWDEWLAISDERSRRYEAAREFQATLEQQREDKRAEIKAHFGYLGIDPDSVSDAGYNSKNWALRPEALDTLIEFARKGKAAQA